VDWTTVGIGTVFGAYDDEEGADIGRVLLGRFTGSGTLTVATLDGANTVDIGGGGGKDEGCGAEVNGGGGGALVFGIESGGTNVRDATVDTEGDCAAEMETPVDTSC